MSEYDSILLSNMAYKFVGAFFSVVMGVSFFKGKDYTSEGEVITYKNKYIGMFCKYILSVILCLFAMYMCLEPIMDFVEKDFQYNKSVLIYLSAPKNNILSEEVQFQDSADMYYFPKKFLGKIKMEKGATYKFTYAKRTKLILQIERTEN